MRMRARKELNTATHEAIIHVFLYFRRRYVEDSFSIS